MKFSNEDSEKTLFALRYDLIIAKIMKCIRNSFISIHRLVPNTILKFTYEGESRNLQEYLKDELLMLVQSM